MTIRQIDLHEWKRLNLERLTARWVDRRVKKLMKVQPDTALSKLYAAAYADLAEAVGVKGERSYIGQNLKRILTGDQGVSDERLVAIALVLGVEPHLFYRDPSLVELELDREAFDAVGWQTFTRAGAEIRGDGDDVVVSAPIEAVNRIRSELDLTNKINNPTTARRSRRGQALTRAADLLRKAALR